MKKLILILLFISTSVNAQEIITFSMEFGTNESKGFEVRKEFDIKREVNGFYVGFFGENIETTDTMFNYGLNTGLYSKSESITLFYGVNIGGIKETAFNSSKNTNLVLGLHSELAYNINESFFIALKGSFNGYNKLGKTNILIRPMFKIGYKF